MNNNSYIKRLTYAKYIYLNGVENLHKRTSISGAVAILMFHDASEQFLMIIADKLGFKIPFGYMGYWEEAKKKGKSLPNKNDLVLFLLQILLGLDSLHGTWISMVVSSIFLNYKWFCFPAH